MARRSWVEVEIRNNRLPELSRKIPTVVEALIRKAAFDTEAQWKAGVRVDTGAYKNSISTMFTAEKGFTAIVFSPIAYGVYNEFGTRYMSANPQMLPAFERNGNTLIRALSSLEGRI